jgi:stage V sporulation protein S
VEISYCRFGYKGGNSSKNTPIFICSEAGNKIGIKTIPIIGLQCIQINLPESSLWRKQNMEGIREGQLIRSNIWRGNSAPPVIRVAADSPTASVAGAIAGMIRDHNYVEIQAIGASAVNQSVKAITLAKGFLSEDGIKISFVPEFVDVEIEGQQRTSIKFKVVVH